MIGLVRFTYRGSTAEAILGDDRTWTAPDPTIAGFLNSHRSYAMADYSPADGQPGARQLHAAASLLGGTAEVEPRPPMPPGTVY
jgi:hypothetical protein